MNSFISRKIVPEIEKLMLEKQVIVITGMRRVGKTTLLKYFFNKLQTENKVFLDLEDVLVRKMFSKAGYENIKLSLEKEGLDFNSKVYVFVDEIQMVPNFPSIIKYLYDKYDIKFVVSGSSSYYLKNQFTQSLSGRKFIIELYPLTFNEFLNFKLIKKETKQSLRDKANQKSDTDEDRYVDLYQEYIRFGGFPEVILTKDKEIKQKIIKDILNSYFQIDVTTLVNFSDVGKLRDLLILLTQRIGQKLNITNLANVLKINRNKVYEYLELLKSTYVIGTVSQKSSINNKVSADDKLYFSDTGIANLLGDISVGSQLENSVYMNLVYDYQLSYFQTGSGGEIDFVLNKKEVALEVKVNAGKTDLANLQKRAKVAKLNEFYLVSLGYIEMDKLIMAWDL